jgi:isopenicillin N synthase-like dioxygenase
VPADLTDAEALAFCYAATIWPDESPDFRAAWEAYYRAVTDLAARIMGVFAVALDLPEGYFEPFIGAPISALRALNYPELDALPRKANSGPAPIPTMAA